MLNVREIDKLFLYYRPWFGGATAHHKSFVFVLDISRGMFTCSSDKTPCKYIMYKIVEHLMETLTSHDQVNYKDFCLHI